MTSVHLPAELLALAPFVDAGVVGPTEVQVVITLARASGETDPAVLLGAALATRAPLHGSVCVDLRHIAATVVPSLDEPVEDAIPPTDPATGPEPGVGDVAALPWPDPDDWVRSLGASVLVTGRDEELAPLVLEGSLLYLARFAALERYVAEDLRSRAARADIGERPVTSEAVAVLDLADGHGNVLDPGQRAAAEAVLTDRLVVMAGGPGTGKTTTVARALAALIEEDHRRGEVRRIGLAAPTGKAAVRMSEAVRAAVAALGEGLRPEVAARLDALEASTLHRLLGRSADGVGFRHGPGNPLPHDVLVVDEVSMVSLALMAHLLAATPPTTTIVLVGDPSQLASVEAGAVLGDVVGLGGAPPPALAPVVSRLAVVHRQAEQSTILPLAAAVRDGDADMVVDLLRSGAADVDWVEPDADGSTRLVPALERAVADRAAAAVVAGQAGDADGALAELLGIKVLCARRRGATGVDGWNDRVEDRLRSRGLIDRSSWYPGRPVMVTRNDYLHRVFNGDVGVALLRDGQYVVRFPREDRSADEPLEVASVRLDSHVTQWAMSIHKSQGSEFDHVVVSLPPPPSRILTRELLYTGITRAKRRLTVVATEAAVRAAVDRPVARASGLAARLDG